MRKALIAASILMSAVIYFLAFFAPVSAQEGGASTPAPVRGHSTDAPIANDGGSGVVPSAPEPTQPTTFEPRAAIADTIDLTALRRMAVQDNGRRKPFDTFAREQVHAILGTDAFRPEGATFGEDPVYTFLSFLFEPDRWVPIRALKLTNQKLIELFKEQTAARLGEAALDGYYSRRGANYISIQDVQGEKFRERMAKIQSGGGASGMGPNPNDGAAIELSNRFGTFVNLLGTMHIAPEPGNEDPEATWSDFELAKLAQADREGVQGALVKARDAFRESKAEECSAALNDFVKRVETLQGDRAPAAWLRTMEVAMNRTRPLRMAWGVLVLGGLLLAGAVATGSRRSRLVGTALLVTGLALATFGLAGRTIIVERAPVANLYEAITFAIYMSVLMGTIFELVYKNALFGTAASLFGFFGFSLIDLAPHMDKAIGPIRPVLVSYWLNIHVTSMLTSYGTFAVAWGLAVLYFAKYLQARGLPRYAIALPLLVAVSGTGILFYRAFEQQMPLITDYALALVGTPLAAVGLTWAWLAADGAPASKISFEDDLYLKSVEKHFYRICQVGFVIITTGIILGAVWANESWGRYWGWDPKETWAFITWLMYGVYIHGRLAGVFRGPTAAIWGIVGFNAVLFTLFGVSFVLPGLHSYLK